MKRTKIISLIVILLLVTLIVPMVAVNATGYEPGDYTGDTNFKGKSSVDKIGNNIIGVLRMIGSIVSVVVLIIIGIKYMTGSVEEKAEYKKTLMPYFVGAIIVFGASVILGAIFEFGKNFANTI